MPTLEQIEKGTYPKIRLTRGPFLRLVRSRWFPWTLIMVNLAVFVVVIMSGIFGVQIGNHNLSIIFVWILWWFALIAILVPFFGRAWCMMCPLPVFGEWLQRRSIVEKKSSKFGLGRKWPKRLSNLWLVNFFFLGLALFSPILTTHPLVTGLLLLSLILIPIGMSVIWEKRTFCHYVCPIGGFIGLYSNFSSLELRADSNKTCLDHLQKECYVGAANGYGCPWFEFPQNLKRNSYCGLCMECMKTCSKNNININLRPFGVDLVKDSKDKDLSEAWKSHMMLGLAALYSFVLLGPYGFIRDWATFRAGPVMFAVYAVFFVGTAMILAPVSFWLTTKLSKRLVGDKNIPGRKLFVDYSLALVPFGLMAWIAFSLALIQVNWSYVFNVAADPFGWGWNILGTPAVSWNPLHPEFLPYEQTGLLLIGLVFTITVAHQIGLKTFKDRTKATVALLPVVGFVVAAMIVMLRLFVG